MKAIILTNAPISQNEKLLLTGTKIYKDAKFNFIYILRSDNDPKTILLKVKLTEKDYK